MEHFRRRDQDIMEAAQASLGSRGTRRGNHTAEPNPRYQVF